MKRRSKTSKNAVPPPGNPAPEPVRVAVLASPRVVRDKLATALADRGCVCVVCASSGDVRDALDHQAVDVVIVDANAQALKTERARAVDIIAESVAKRPDVSWMVLSTGPSLDDCVEAMRAGACDVVTAGMDTQELTRRVEAAADRARRVRQNVVVKAERQVRLKKLCRQLNTARHELSRQVGTLCSNLSVAYKDMSDQLGIITVASEFNSIIRQELDLEGLLRVGLEFMLAKIGPTNAGVFLPATSGDFSLGAYVNYDCGKDSAEVLMDHLADVVPGKFERERDVVVLSSREEMQARLGEAAHWLSDHTAMFVSCRHDSECLAVITFFRSRNSPFPPGLLPTVRVLADLFGKQLARVIHVHHRHLPKNKWGSPGDPYGDGDIDTAA